MHRRTGWPAGVAGRFRRSGLVASVTRGNEGAIFPAFDAGQATGADTPYVQTNFSYVVPAAVLAPQSAALQMRTSRAFASWSRVGRGGPLSEPHPEASSIGPSRQPGRPLLDSLRTGRAQARATPCKAPLYERLGCPALGYWGTASRSSSGRRWSRRVMPSVLPT